MRRTLSLVAALALAGCGTTHSGIPRVETKVVEVPVPVACKVDLGPEPDYDDTDAKLLASRDLFERVQRLTSGRLQRIARDMEKTAALQGCSGK